MTPIIMRHPKPKKVSKSKLKSSSFEEKRVAISLAHTRHTIIYAKRTESNCVAGVAVVGVAVFGAPALVGNGCA